MEFPRLFYKLGGPWQLESGFFSVREVANAEQAEALDAEGWRGDQYAAKDVGGSLVIDTAPPEIQEADHFVPAGDGETSGRIQIIGRNEPPKRGPGRPKKG